MNIAAIMLTGLELQKISLHAWGIKISLDAIKMKFLHLYITAYMATQRTQMAASNAR